jgi:hypothetical protein
MYGPAKETTTNWLANSTFRQIIFMTKRIIQFLSVLMSGLVAGTIFGILIGYNPKDLSVTTYVEQQQAAIRALNTLMPILGLIAIILTTWSAFLHKKNKLTFSILLIAATLLLISGLVTRFGNQPINAIVITWNLNNIPDSWVHLRDKWWSFHIIRTSLALIAFALIIWTTVKPEETSGDTAL